MNRPMRDYTDLLLSRGVISLEQLTEAKALSSKQEISIGKALVSLDMRPAMKLPRLWPNSIISNTSTLMI